MQHAPLSRYSDPYGRYYTREYVAERLVQLMGANLSGAVLELGAGDGSLVRAAARHWPAASFTAADIDPNAKCFELRTAGVRVHATDALSPELGTLLELAPGSVDVALCNPPYLRLSWCKYFSQLLDDAGLGDCLLQQKFVPADALFVAQNLRFLRPGGKLGLIVPDGLIAGEKCVRLRSALATQHHLERVVELPRHSFGRTEAKAHLVVLTKQGTPEQHVELQQLSRKGVLSDVLRVPVARAIERMDYSYHQRTASTGTQLRDLAPVISRGSTLSSKRAAHATPAFHTTDFQAAGAPVPARFQLPAAQGAQASLAQAGDILLARVGRNLELKVASVSAGLVSHTDAVFRIRLAPAHQQRVLTFLASPTGRAALRAASRGVGAKFLTKEALLELAL